MSTDIQKADAALPKIKPATDIVEQEDGFHIFLDMPGVGMDNMAIDLNENELIVSGTSPHDCDDNRNLAVMEFTGCEYRRTFTLSDAVDKEKIKASMDNGVLTIHLPRRTEDTPKRIQINAG
ncbi:MAG: Hsp20/alpha crystallin family protein [Desulfovibrio sp.]|uniref:Hsp20/alpha crystallin family protein n=1 Tax=Desulfovibrio sp. 7SRBS1 TaxID=3378064 RepID=UPI003B3E205F